MDSRDFDKEEFITLRAESQFHQVNASAIFALNVTGVGIGVAVSSNESVALPLIALLSSVLWLRYLDHVVAVFRVAAYVACWLRPRLCEKLDDPKVLVWEEFLRSSDDPPKKSQGDRWPLTKRPGLPHTPRKDSRRGIDIASLAFAVPALTMILLYGYHLWSTPATGIRLVVLIGLAALVFLFWLFAVYRVWRSRIWIGKIDASIKEAVAERPVLSRRPPDTPLRSPPHPRGSSVGQGNPPSDEQGGHPGNGGQAAPQASR